MTDGLALAEPVGFDLLGEPVRLAAPGALALLVAVAAVAALGLWSLHARRAALRAAAGPLAARVAPSARPGRAGVRLGLGWGGLALLAIALARPQCGARVELQKRLGADLVIVLDASRSMLARDVRPDRLGRAKLEIAQLLDGLAGDRVAIVVFADQAFVQCPLTTDYAAAKLFLRAVGPDAIPRQGTALADALLAAKEVLEGAERGGARGKVVLLVTDGEDHEGGAEDAARALAGAGVHVHALAVGGRAGAPIPVADAAGNVTGYLTDRRGERVVTRLDEAGLQAIAARGGGQVFDAESSARGIAAFRAELARAQKSELEGRTAVAWEDRYARVAFPAFLLLLAALLWPEAGRPPREGAP